jgi:hypothetical protein
LRLFEVESLLEDRDRSRTIDQLSLFLGAFPTFGEPLGGRYGCQPFVYEPDRHFHHFSQPFCPLASLCGRRSLGTTQAAGKADAHLDRLVLCDDIDQLRDLTCAGPNRGHRIGQHAVRVTRCNTYPRVTPVKGNPYAASHASSSLCILTHLVELIAISKLAHAVLRSKGHGGRAPADIRGNHQRIDHDPLSISAECLPDRSDIDFELRRRNLRCSWRSWLISDCAALDATA